MHIVYFTHQFFPRHIGGVETYTLALAKHARAAGHKVTVVAYHESRSLNPVDYGPQYTVVDEIPVVEIHYNFSSSPHAASYEYNNLFTANVLRIVLPKIKPDLVHIMHAMKLSTSVLNVCDVLQIPFIVTMCDFWFICPRATLLKWDNSLCNGPAHRLYCLKCVQELHGFAKGSQLFKDLPAIAKRNAYIKEALLKARRIIVLSDFQKKMLAQNGIPVQRMELIQHGLDQPLDEPDPHLPSKPYCIGFIGSLVEHKGLHILLEALAQLPDADVQCRIYGAMENSPYVNRLRHLAENDQRIRFMGTFDPSNLFKVINTMDVLAAPSIWYENEPLVIKAALRAGIPVLCHDIGSLSGMITPGKTGWFVPINDVDAWAETIRNVLAQLPGFHMQPVRIKTMEENGREMLLIYSEEFR
jgi:glycosyltransferase involved in cell wall biosynthesis